MDSVIAFLSMGGYAAYVWPAYGIAFVIMAWLGIAARTALRRQERMLEMLEKGRQTGGGDGP